MPKMPLCREDLFHPDVAISGVFGWYFKKQKKCVNFARCGGYLMYHDHGAYGCPECKTIEFVAREGDVSVDAVAESCVPELPLPAPCAFVDLL